MRLRSSVAATAAALTVVATAGAAWDGGGAGDGAAAARTLAVGPTPSATAPALSLTITVSWTAAPLATGYVITRRNALGVAEAPGGTCAGVVTATSCSETVLAGTYRYAASIRRNGWEGSPGTESAPVTVPGL